MATTYHTTPASDFFNALMSELWGGGTSPPWEKRSPTDFIIKAVADRFRGTQHLNHENALEILHALGPDFYEIVDVRGSDDVRGADDNKHVAIFTIKFYDGSTGLIEAPHGIGSAFELIGA